MRRRVVAGTRLCRACHDSLVTALEKLPGLYRECGRLLAGSDRPRDRTSGGPLPGLPFNAAAADARDSILRVLASWSGLVVEQRHVTAPRRTVGALAGFLGRHVDWVAAQSIACDVTDEVAELVRSARRVAYPRPLRRVPVGACVEVGCGGGLFAVVDPDEALLPSEICCDTDPQHRWPAHRWTQLRRSMSTEPSAGEPAARWLSASDISRLWAVPPGSVYRLASERRWRRRSEAHRTYYHEADVAETFHQREQRSTAKAL